MSEDKNKLDELFRNQFENVELPVSDKLLQNIKRDLDIPEQKRRSGFWLWALLGVLLVLVSIGAYWFVSGNVKEITNTAINLNSEANTKVEENKQLAENVPNKEVEVVKEANAIEGSNHEPVKEKVLKSANTEIRTESKEGVRTSGETSSESKTILSKTKINAGTLNSKNETSPKIIEALSVKKLKKEKNIPSSKPDLDALSKENKNAEVKKSKEKSIQDKKNGVVPSEKKPEKVVDGSQNESSKSIEKSTVLAETEKTGDDVKKSNASNEVEKSDEMKNNSVAVSTNDKGEEKAVQEAVKKDSLINANKKPVTTDSSANPKNILEAKEDKPKKNHTFFVDAGAGPSLTFRSLSANGNSVALDRNKYENNLLTYNAGVDFGVLIKEKFVVSIGLGIDNKGEKYSYPHLDSLMTTGLDTIYGNIAIDSTLLPDSTYQYIYPIDSINEVQHLLRPSIVAKSGYNTYQYFKLPIMFGYKFTITDKWFVTANVGIVLNYLYKVNVFLENASGESVYYTKTNSVFNSTSISTRLKLDIGYDLSEHWSVLAQPGYTRFMQSIYRKEQPFKQYPYSYDFNIAVRYKF